MVVGLVFAGNDTTRNQLGLGMVSFLRHPEQWERLGADPALAPRAVEEILRERPTISGLLRIVTEPFSYRDLDFTPGTAISLFTGPANADAAIFGDPDFDITVERPIEHLTFGGGIHRCLGSWLARAEMQEALPILARRLRGIRPAGDVVWRPPTGIAGPASLPLAFEVPIP
jgi:cytochrome P450